MSKPYTETDLSIQLDSELNWRRRELSDLKSAIRNADVVARRVLLRSLVTISYAHWEGYIRISASKYFSHIAMKKKPYRDLDRQFYTNSFLVRLDAFYRSKASMKDASAFITSIMDSQESRFTFLNSKLIDTKSNLNTDVINDLCLVCGFSGAFFEDNRIFIDMSLLKKRNAIAHGQDEGIDERDMDDFIKNTLSLLEHFKTLIENNIYGKNYLSKL